MTTLEENRALSLKEANRVRRQRSLLKGEVRQAGGEQGRFILAAALEDLPDWLESQDAWDFLGWAPRVGDASVDGLMVPAGVTCKGPLSGLSSRQRGLLAGLLRVGSQRWAGLGRDET